MNNNLNLKLLILIVVGLFASCMFLFGNFKFYGLIEISGFFPAYSISATITTTIVSLFLWQGWKIPLLNGWLVLTPNLNGTWEGKLKSDWVNPETKESIAPINSILLIKQSLFGMSCVVRTGEMTSYSISANIEKDKNNHVHRLIYTYRSEPKISLKKRSSIHHGTAVLEFNTAPYWQLNGSYFTERNTTGEIELKFRDRKIDVTLTKSEKRHPMDK